MLGVDEISYVPPDGGSTADGASAEDAPPSTDASDAQADAGPRAICIAGGQVEAGLTESDEVYCAAIVDEAGDLGPWLLRSTMPAAVGSVGYAQDGNTWFVIGGTGIQGATDKTYVGTVDADGGIQWRQGQPLPAPRTTHVAGGERGMFFVAGGAAGGVVTSSVLVSTDPDRVPWTPGSALPDSRTRAAVATTSGLVYLLGGSSPIDGSAPAAPLATRIAGGGLEPWVAYPPVLPKREGNFAFAYGGRLYFGGGIADDGGAATARLLDDVLSAEISPADGGLSSWTPAGTLGGARQRAAAVVARGHLYVIGGAANTLPTPTPDLKEVVRFDFDANGSLVGRAATAQLPRACTAPAVFLAY